MPSQYYSWGRRMRVGRIIRVTSEANTMTIAPMTMASYMPEAKAALPPVIVPLPMLEMG